MMAAHIYITKRTRGGGEYARLMRIVGVVNELFNEEVPNFGRVRCDEVIREKCDGGTETLKFILLMCCSGCD